MKLKIDLENKAQVVAASAFFNALASELGHTTAPTEVPVAKVSKPRKPAKVKDIADGDPDKKAVMEKVQEQAPEASKTDKSSEPEENEGVTLREVKSFFVSTQQADPAKGKILMGVIKAKGLSNLAEATKDQLADILKEAKAAVK